TRLTARAILLKKPVIKAHSLLECFQVAFQHEQAITKRINKIVAQAFEEKDFGTFEFMQWFLAEQRKEESSVDDIVDRLEMAGDNVAALLAIDERLLERSENSAAEA
ncbi:MAG: ferritin-like domain-containing protein, partial [Spirochaetota bacterium]